MKIGILGCGSIGLRHITNLKALGFTDFQCKQLKRFSTERRLPLRESCAYPEACQHPGRELAYKLNQSLLDVTAQRARADALEQKLAALEQERDEAKKVAARNERPEAPMSESNAVLTRVQVETFGFNAGHSYRPMHPGSCDKQRDAACRDVMKLVAHDAALREQNRALREALKGLLEHIDLIEYRDKAGLRLGPTIPRYEQAQQALDNAATDTKEDKP